MDCASVIGGSFGSSAVGALSMKARGQSITREVMEAHVRSWLREGSPGVIARHSRSKNGVASLACGDEAIQRARSAPKTAAVAASSAHLLARLPARAGLLRCARSDG